MHAKFLDISKAFEKIRLPSLIFKVKHFGISCDLLKLIRKFLSNRFQRVVLNEQTSEWEQINARVLQGSIVRPCFLLMTHHFLQLFKIRMIQHHNLTMTLTKLVIRLIHEKCLLTSKRSDFFNEV